jgi:hypothetical protein
MGFTYYLVYKRKKYKVIYKDISYRNSKNRSNKSS